MATELPRKQAVVVGVGWAGGIIAAELTKAGIEVIGLERGQEKTVDDFKMQKDELRYALRYDLMQDLSKETITFRNDQDMRALPMRQLGSFLLGTDVGGAGIHWNGQCPRFLPYDFEIRSKTEERYGSDKIPADMTLQDWGISYDEIEPYFQKFDETIGTSGEDNDLTAPRSEPFPTPPMKETRALRKFKNAAEELGYHPYQVASANLSEVYENPDGQTIQACQYCSFCERFGCDYQAKSDPVITVIPTAKETGNFELRTHANVRRVSYDGEKTDGVYFIDTRTGEEFYQPADVVVLTTYVMNNTRLLLQSEIGRPYNPETNEGVIGKNYCYQVMASAQGFFEEERFNLYAGAGALGAALDDFNGDNFDHSDEDFIHGGIVQITQTGIRPINTNPVPSDVKSWGKEFKEASLHYFYRTLTVASQGASMPYRYNYLDLDPTYKDALGDPLLRMTYNFTEQDRKLAAHQTKRCAEVLEAMNPDKIEANEDIGDYDIVPYQTTHNTGGVIMGGDPETSAVNNYLQMWDCENLFVAGASAFAHNSGYNPTPTVGAIAYRAADGIKKYFENPGALA
ncbi:gluconate 2-dehydrogenase alpha chain [Salsuginibacillus halophilus]|uniref:Gluconate 2-dehydrogenase alpha chain n=1 Tax=Salsuginibacillus halophilus TaxID=517424 RepID=A0A2P8HWP2_9BACI|nr:GMC family oxidoreductase [Salsuginibacillus halophilus]PSL50632.1 gluconate 2-dehydrogenase alpha chain [Salsuginibacillus halophilus]